LAGCPQAASCVCGGGAGGFPGGGGFPFQNMRRQQQKEIQKTNNMVLFDTHYWYLEEFSCVYIPRNREWFEDAIPKIHDIWNTILKERVEGYEHRAPKKRLAKNQIDVSINSDSTSYSVKNMPITNTICLIKLDENGNIM
jgi:hypothetical protein